MEEKNIQAVVVDISGKMMKDKVDRRINESDLFFQVNKLYNMIKAMWKITGF